MLEAQALGGGTEAYFTVNNLYAVDVDTSNCSVVFHSDNGNLVCQWDGSQWDYAAEMIAGITRTIHIQGAVEQSQSTENLCELNYRIDLGKMGDTASFFRDHGGGSQSCPKNSSNSAGCRHTKSSSSCAPRRYGVRGDTRRLVCACHHDLNDALVTLRKHRRRGCSASREGRRRHRARVSRDGQGAPEWLVPLSSWPVGLARHSDEHRRRAVIDGVRHSAVTTTARARSVRACRSSGGWSKGVRVAAAP
jgi:hypothetical protein